MTRLSTRLTTTRTQLNSIIEIVRVVKLVQTSRQCIHTLHPIRQTPARTAGTNANKLITKAHYVECLTQRELQHRIRNSTGK